MYTRSYNRNRDSRYQRYTPPPGYVGTAFSEETGVKHHMPEQELLSHRADDRDIDERETILDHEDEASAVREESGERREIERKEESPLTSLIESLRGKLSAEELIILMTMFLISSDGICVEVLILALILIAGREQ